MKKQSLIFKEKRHAVHTEMKALEKKRNGENRDFTEAEEARYDELDKHYESHTARILSEEKAEARQAELVAEEMAAEKLAAEQREKEEGKKQKRQGGKQKGTPEQRAIRDYSFIKAIRQARNGDALDGIEKEMYDEAKKENSEIGIELRGNVAVPAMFFNFEKRTTLTAGTPATAGNLISTDLGGLIEALRPKLVMDEMGVRRLGGLVGNLEMPRKTATTQAAWVGENVTSPESNPTFDKISLSPKRLTSTTVVSDMLLRQSSLDVEAMVRGDLNLAISEKLNETMINGAGTGNIPLGILNIPGINLIDLGTDGAALTFADVERFLALVDDKNALMGNLGFLMNPLTRFALKTTKKDAGSGEFVMRDNNDLSGYKAGVTTHMPKNLTKGAGTDLSAMIYGNFNDFIVASWGGISMIVDPYSKKTEAEVEVTVHSYHDTDYRHAESFAAALDIVTS